MPSRDEEIPVDARHMSASDIATYMRTDGKRLGREYKTHGEIWDVDKDVVQIGLLHLILDELQKDKAARDPMDAHATWLTQWRPEMLIILESFEAQRARLFAMFGTEDLGEDVQNGFGIHESSLLYRKNLRRHWEYVYALNGQLQRLSSVKKPEDIVNLRGIGKKTAAKLIEGIRGKSIKLSLGRST